MASKTRFTRRVLEESGCYETEIIDLTTSSRDRDSVLLSDPRTWLRGPRATPGEVDGLAFTHVGAFLGELEFQRYRPRGVLTRLLKRFDAVQFVVGHPPWACAAPEELRQPVLLYTGTMMRPDRATRLSLTHGFRKMWMEAMTAVVARMEKTALDRVDHIFTVSRYTYDALLPFVDAARMSFVGCGVDTDVFHPSPLPAEAFILAVGRFDDARKNVRNLLEAYAQLLRLLPDAPELCLAGVPPGPDDRSFLERLGVGEKVRMLGEVSLERLAELHREASLFVLSSNQEGLGIVLLEAMASGEPIVSTDCGGPASCIEEGRTGLLVPPRDPRALAGAMQRILSDGPLRRGMRLAARQQAVERFSVPAVGAKILSVYARLLP